MQALWLTLLFFPCLLFGQTYPLFTPPPHWALAHPDTLAKRALVGFLDTRQSGFCPSITLTTEKTDLAPDQYLQIVQDNCKKKRQSWRHLGSLQTQAGLAELTELEVKTQFGPARIMQAILFKDGVAYILTAGALKKEFARHAASIEKSFTSFTLTDDLFSLIQDETLQEQLRTGWQKKRTGLESKAFEYLVLKECASLGAVWQMFVLQ